jgi:hypothetical protein
MDTGQIQSRVSRLRRKLVGRHLLRLAFAAGVRLGLAMGAMAALVALLAWAGLGLAGDLAESLLDAPRLAVIVSSAYAATFAALAFGRKLPTNESAELLLESLAGSPGSVPLAVRGIGGGPVNESATAAIARASRQPLAPLFDAGARTRLGLALVVFAGGLGMLALAPRTAQQPPPVALPTPASSRTASHAQASGPRDAGADAVAALRNELLAGTPDQRAAAAARYAELWRRAAEELAPAAGAPSTAKRPTDSPPSATEQAKAAASALQDLAEDGVAPGSATQQAIEAALADMPGDKFESEDQSAAKAWLETHADLIRELVNASDLAIPAGESVARGSSGTLAGSAPMAGSSSNPRGDPIQPGGASGGTGTQSTPTTPALMPTTAVSIPIPAPGQPPASRAAYPGRAAIAGARYLAALERGTGSKTPRPNDAE